MLKHVHHICQTGYKSCPVSLNRLCAECTRTRDIRFSFSQVPLIVERSNLSSSTWRRQSHASPVKSAVVCTAYVSKCNKNFLDKYFSQTNAFRTNVENSTDSPLTQKCFHNNTISLIAEIAFVRRRIYSLQY